MTGLSWLDKAGATAYPESFRHMPIVPGQQEVLIDYAMKLADCRKLQSLAFMLEIDISQLSRVARGQARVTPLIVLQLYDVLGIPIEMTRDILLKRGMYANANQQCESRPAVDPACNEGGQCDDQGQAVAQAGV